MKLRRKLQSFLNLAAGDTAGLDLPLGMSFHGIMLKLSATGVGADFTIDHLERVRLLLNGKAIIRDIPGNIVFRDNLSRGSTNNNGYLFLDFEDPRSKDLGDQYRTLIHTAAGVNSFRIELDIAAAAAGTLKIESWALMSATGLPLGPIPALIKEGLEISSTGVREYTPGFKVGPEGPGHIFRCVHLVFSQGGTEVAPSAVLGENAVTLRKSGIPVWDRFPDDANRWLQTHYENTPQTNFYTLDWGEDNAVGVNLMPTADATDMVFELDIADASPVVKTDVYYRLITTLERL